MRGQKVGHALPFFFLDTVERLEKANHVLWVIAGEGAVLDAQFIRFQFVVAAVAKEEQLRGHATEIHQILRGEPEHSLADQGAAEQEPLTYLLLPGLARRVTGGHVADLMRQDAGELILVIQMGEHSPGDIDVSSRKRHGVDDRTVEDGEGYRSVAKLFFGSGPPEVTGCENTVTDLRDVALELRIAVETEKRGDFFTALPADLGFLLPGIAEKAFLAGSRNNIRSAADVKKRGQGEGRQSSEHSGTD